ncbi:phosphate signaling complex PhoU family protein, partial [Bacteroides uniformis]
MGDQNLAEILKVKKQFVAMGTLVSSQIHQATKSFLEHDTILAKQVISKDQQVNQTEIELEKNVFDVLIRKNPMASDFRET